jgi:hypothetical protein
VSELDPRVRALLDAACGADDPTAEERAANRTHLARRFTLLGIAASTLVPGSASASALSVGGSAASGLTKLVLLWVSVGAVASTVIGGAMMAARPSKPAVVVPASTELAAPRSLPNAQMQAKRSQPSDETVSTVAVSDLPMETSPDADSSRRRDLAASREVHGASADPSAGTETPRAPAAPDLSQALEALARAQKQLNGGRPDQALGTLDEFARRAPGAPMGEERQALRIVALCRLGPGRGMVQAERFLRQAGNSPLSTRVRAACRL